MGAEMIGFELVTTADLTSLGWTVGGASIVTSNTHQSNGFGSARGIGLTAVNTLTPVITSITPRGVSCYFWYSGSARGGQPLGWLLYRGGGVTFTARINPTSHAIELRRGSMTGTLVATSVGTLSPGTGYWLDIESDNQDAGGAVTAFINQASFVTFSGDTKAHASLTGWDQVSMEGISSDVIDDMVFWDSTTGRPSAELYGNSQTLNAIAVSPAQTGFGTLGGGAASAIDGVDDRPFARTEYVEGTAVNDLIFATQNSIGFTPASVYGMAAYALMTRDGTITKGEVGISQSGTSWPGAATTLPATGSWGICKRDFLVDPDTGAAFTTANLNNYKVGARIT